MPKYEIEISRVVSKRYKCIVIVEAKTEDDAEDIIWDDERDGKIQWEEIVDERTPSDACDLESIREISQ